MTNLNAMKKFTLLAFLFISFAFASAQTYNVTVSGTVIDTSTSSPIANQMVYLKLGPVSALGNVWVHDDSVLTNASGAYSFTVAVPTNIAQGGGAVWTTACNALYSQTFTFFNAPSGNNHVKNFSVCGSGSGGTGGSNCTANFQYTTNGLTISAYTNFMGSGPQPTWTFGNGSTGTGFQVSNTYSSAGTYTVCMYVYDTSGAVCDSKCVAVQVTSGGGSGPFTLAGSVWMSNNAGGMTSPQAAEVFLIEYDQQQGTLTAIDTVTVTPSAMNGGTYIFNNVPAGTYRVKAALLSNDPQYSNFLPTYHTSMLFWNQATTVSLNGNIAGINITMIQGNNPGGPGFVGGLVSQGANKKAGVGDPVEDIQVMLLNTDDTAVQYMYSDSNGQFSFSNVAYGTYKVWAEVIGKTTTPIYVTVDSQNTTLDNIQIWVTSNSVVVSNNQPKTYQDFVTVYPNPVKDIVYLKVEASKAAEMQLRMTDMTGKQLFDGSISVTKGINTLPIKLQQMTPGIYFIQTELDGSFEVNKIIKQ